MRIKLALKTLAAQNPYLVAHSTEGRWVFCFVLQVRAFLCYKTLSGWKTMPNLFNSQDEDSGKNRGRNRQAMPTEQSQLE